MPKSIIVIGAGIGGLAAAIRLAHAGYDITVLEKNPRVGGKVYSREANGFRWDTGPPFITMKPLLEEFFADVGQDMVNYLRLLPLEPLARYFFPDGTTFDLNRDWPALAAQIARHEPADVGGFLRFLAYAARLHRDMDPLKPDRQFNDAPDAEFLLAPRLRPDSLRSMSRAIRSFVDSEKLQRILEHFAAFAGADPYRAPAALNTIAHRILTGGAWYPQDGLGAIPAALERLALESGVSIRLNALVSQIAVERNRAIGVALEETGSLLHADAVLSNVDVISTQRYLLPPGAIAAPALRQLYKTKVTASAFNIMLGVRGVFPQLSHHNVLFPADVKRECGQIFQHETMPDDPTIAITVSSKSDPLHAPVNQENWLIQVKAPALSEKLDWSARQEEYRDRIISILHQRYGLDLRGRIRSEVCLSQADWGRMTGAWRGSLHGPSPDDRRALFERPLLQSSRVNRLYFAGATVYPGGGIPMALLSAKLATGIIRDQIQ